MSTEMVFQPEKEIELDVDIEQLILEIRKRAALWNSSIPEYKDKILKRQLWLEVCEIFHPDFEGLSTKLKSVVVREVQFKWKRIRDCYSRSLRITNARAKEGKRGSKKYVYSRFLHFLDGFIGSRDSLQKVKEDNSKDDAAAEETGVDSNDESNTDKNSTIENQDAHDCLNADKDETPCRLRLYRRRGSVRNEREFISKAPQKKIARLEESVFPKNLDPCCPRNHSLNSTCQEEPGSFRIDQSSSSLKDNSNCDDMDFFRSLLPIIKPLPLHDRVKFRIDVMKIALDYHEKLNKS